MKDNGESGRTACIEMIKEYPIEMDTLHGVNFMFTNNIEFTIAMYLWSSLVHEHQGSGKVDAGAIELAVVSVPIMILAICTTLHVANYIVSHFFLILLCIYPIAGPYYILMSNPDYNKRVNRIKENVRSKLCCSRSNCKVTSVSSTVIGSTTS
ncbi:unnamed protein product [Auanema sp. JU1783]|nr:unnamed protein product [Auanema sp. JU1783]